MELCNKCQYMGSYCRRCNRNKYKKSSLPNTAGKYKNSFSRNF